MGQLIWTPVCLLIVSTLVMARCLPTAPRHRHHASLHQHAATLAAAAGIGESPSMTDWKPTLEARTMVANANDTQHLADFDAGSGQVSSGRAESPPTTPFTDALAAEYQRAHRKKQKEARLKEIQRTIMEILNVQERPIMNSSYVLQGQRIKEIYDKVYVNSTNSQPILHNFLPSCEMPRNTDDEMWNSAQHYHLYFDLSSLIAHSGSNLYILSAKLKLLKLSEGDAFKKDGEPCLETVLANRPTITDLASDDERVRVTVHQYTKPLKKGKASKTKIMDSQMVPSRGDSLMEFNVRNAIRQWAPSTNNRDRNFGFLVEVEDTEKHRRPAAAFFLKRDCVNKGKEVRLAEDKTTTLPVLEISTLEYPDTKTSLENLQSANSNSHKNIPNPRKRKTESQPDRSSNIREDEPILLETVDDPDDALDDDSHPILPPKMQHMFRHGFHSDPNSEVVDSVVIVPRRHLAPQSKNGQTRDRLFGESQQHNFPTVQTPQPTLLAAEIRESPLATLATLEDIDFMGSEDNDDDSELSNSRIFHREPANIFIRRLILSGLHIQADGDQKS